MTHRSITAEDYMQWLLVEPKWTTMTEAARCSPKKVAHDSWRRFLLGESADSEALWKEVQGQVKRKKGHLILDDSTLDKPYGPKIEQVSWHWSGKHREVVQGINLVTLLWTDGQILIPIDFRIYHKDSDGKTKNDHFKEMLQKAHTRGFEPKAVLFDSWYASVENLKFLQNLSWTFLSRLKSNRIIGLGPKVYVPVGQLLIEEGVPFKVHLRKFGFILVFRKVSKNGDVESWMTNDLEMDEPKREELAHIGFGIEIYHRALKQECCVERCQARNAHIQHVHISLSIRAFFRLELHRIQQSLSYWELGRQLIRTAVRAYLEKPLYLLDTVA